MSIAFRTVDVKFDPAKGDTQNERGLATFDYPVVSADACIKGFDIGYTSADHELYQEKIDVKNVFSEGKTVFFDVEFGLRDKSGDWDDLFDGRVSVLVTAEVHTGGDGGN